MSSKPLVSVIVPCRNEKPYIEACVRSILAQEQPEGGIEVIVADGMSEDGTREILACLTKEDSRVRMLDNVAREIAAGLNQAIQQARGMIIIRMDAHSTYASDYIQECLRVLAETGADNVGGPVRTESRGYVQAAICAAYHSPFSTGYARFHDVSYQGYLDTVPYGCWRRKIFELIGLFDEALGRNEDDEFNLRLIRAGGKIFQSPRIRSWYHPRGSFRSLYEQQLQYGYWKVRVIQKHNIPASIRHLVPGAFVLSLILSMALSPWSRIAQWSLVGIAGLYLSCNLVACCVTAFRAGWRVFPALPIAFGCYHLGYGYGFLRGIIDFVVLRREPSRIYKKITRKLEG